MQNTGRADVSICELDGALRARIAERYRIGRSYASIDEALTSEWDAAVIATPAHLHIPMANQLADGGTPMLIEKPLSTQLNGIDELMRKVGERKLPAVVAYVLRTHPGLRAVKAALDSRRFGCPLQLRLIAGQHFPTFRPAYREIYYADRATGGGAIQDAITHYFNAGEWLVGPITRMAVDAAHQLLEGVVVEDTVNALVRHGRVMGSYSLNQYQAPNESSLSVVCQAGTVRWELHEQAWSWMDKPNSGWHVEPAVVKERDDHFIR